MTRPTGGRAESFGKDVGRFRKAVGRGPKTSGKARRTRCRRTRRTQGKRPSRGRGKKVGTMVRARPFGERRRCEARGPGVNLRLSAVCAPKPCVRHACSGEPFAPRELPMTNRVASAEPDPGRLDPCCPPRGARRKPRRLPVSRVVELAEVVALDARATSQRSAWLARPTGAIVASRGPRCAHRFRGPEQRRIRVARSKRTTAARHVSGTIRQGFL